jgi:uncharacterized protein (TIGR03032 family)
LGADINAWAGGAGSETEQAELAAQFYHKVKQANPNATISRSNIADGWRDHRRDSGIVIDVATGETVAGGLSMPHSPRLHDGRLYLLQAGTGEFGWIDLATGRFTALCFLPGFARGLAFLGNHAVIGVLRPPRRPRV